MNSGAVRVYIIVHLPRHYPPALLPFIVSVFYPAVGSIN